MKNVKSLVFAFALMAAAFLTPTAAFAEDPPDSPALSGHEERQTSSAQQGPKGDPGERGATGPAGKTVYVGPSVADFDAVANQAAGTDRRLTHVQGAVVSDRKTLSVGFKVLNKHEAQFNRVLATDKKQNERLNENDTKFVAITERINSLEASRWWGLALLIGGAVIAAIVIAKKRRTK